MQITREYRRTLFPAEVVAEAIAVFKANLPRRFYHRFLPRKVVDFSGIRMIEMRNGNKTDYDTDEEFLAEYRKGFSGVLLSLSAWLLVDYRLTLHFFQQGQYTSVSVEAPGRPTMERIFEVFERNAASARLPDPPTPKQAPEPPPVVFIGHGGSVQWRDLKDHLHEKHGYRVEAYEIGERAGHAIRDILESMLAASSFAVLVMTGEDKQAGGELRARQNVVHELGLFQGRLGFNRAVVSLEEGTEGFSNLQGIHQIRYAKGNIKETYGDVLAALRREFHREEK